MINIPFHKQTKNEDLLQYNNKGQCNYKVIKSDLSQMNVQRCMQINS